MPSTIDPPNPYHGMRLGPLAEALSKRASDLLAERQVGRRDVAYLLISAAAAIRPAVSNPGDAAARVQAHADAAVDAFAEVLQREQRALRWWVFRQAVDAMGGVGAGPAFDRLSQMAVTNDEQCMSAIGRLATLADRDS